MPNPGIHSPDDLKGLSLERLRELAEDIRQTIVSTCLKNGGHLGASLGAVELAIALHSSFTSPEEPLIWDVGHQAYAHKLLTGRWDKFSTLRQGGGLSGFLSRDESKHDVFGAGHSSTALSAALAMAWAHGKNPSQSSKWTVAVVGDGGLTAGVALEALNNVQALVSKMAPLLVVLNDNQMSISPNVGSIPAILAGGHADEFFTGFGLDYVGPIDGHDLATLIGTLNGIKKGYAGKPILLHVITQKGKGYFPAEQQPAAFHGVSPVQVKIPDQDQPKQKTYSDAFGETLCKLAETDEKIVAITAAMPEGTGLAQFASRFPDRFFDVGIAEPHAVTFAAGLATQGFKPVVAIYSTFFQRAYDAVIHDVAIQKLGVTFALDRAGVVGADGPTHHGAFDISYLKTIPNFRVTAPCSLEDLSELLKEAVDSRMPFSLRYPRGSGPSRIDEPLVDGLRFHSRASQPGLIIVSLGACATRVMGAVHQIRNCTHISTTEIKPISIELIRYLDQNPDCPILCVEEGAIEGGFGQSLLAHIKPRKQAFRILGYDDHFIPHGSVGKLDETEGLSESAIKKSAENLLEPL